MLIIPMFLMARYFLNGAASDPKIAQFFVRLFIRMSRKTPFLCFSFDLSISIFCLTCLYLCLLSELRNAGKECMVEGILRVYSLISVYIFHSYNCVHSGGRS